MRILVATDAATIVAGAGGRGEASRRAPEAFVATRTTSEPPSTLKPSKVTIARSRRARPLDLAAGLGQPASKLAAVGEPGPHPLLKLGAIERALQRGPSPATSCRGRAAASASRRRLRRSRRIASSATVSRTTMRASKVKPLRSGTGSIVDGPRASSAKSAAEQARALWRLSGVSCVSTEHVVGAVRPSGGAQRVKVGALHRPRRAAAVGVLEDVVAARDGGFVMTGDHAPGPRRLPRARGRDGRRRSCRWEQRIEICNVCWAGSVAVRNLCAVEIVVGVPFPSRSGLRRSD